MDLEEQVEVNATQEAALLGLSLSRVSRARRDPDHPANSPQANHLDRSTLVPAAAVTAYWQSRRRTPGPAVTDPARIAGVTRRQWAALQRIAVDPTARISASARRGLVAAGYLTEDGQVTDQARARIADVAAASEDDRRRG